MVPCLGDPEETIKLAFCSFQISISLFIRTVPLSGAIGKANNWVLGSREIPDLRRLRMQVSALARFERFFLNLDVPLTDSPAGKLTTAVP